MLFSFDFYVCFIFNIYLALLVMIKSSQKIIWNVIYSKRWYIITLILIYALNLDDLLDPQIDGPEFAISALIFEFLMATCAYIAKRNYGIDIRRQITSLKIKLKSIDQKKDTVEYIKITRQIRNLSKMNTPLRTPEICNFVRSTLPNFLFINKYVCVFPNNYFWSPISAFVSYPHEPTNSELKVGFAFFWNSLITFDNFLIEYLPKE